VDGNHSTVYTSADILAHPSVQLTRGGLILIGLLSGGDYHQAGLPRCGPGIAHGLAKCGFGDDLLKAAHSLSRDELSDFLTTWRDDLRAELRINARGHLGSKKPSLAKTVPDSFPDIDVLLSYTNPIISATDAGARRTHTPPKWEREPDLGKLAHLCELHFEWGLKDIIIKRFRTIIWPSIVLRALRRSALEAATDNRGASGEPLQDVFGTPSKLLARHFSSMGFGAQDTGGEGDGGLRELIVKIHSSRTHAYTDSILEYRLEVAPAQLVRLASAGIQGLRKPADTTYDVLPSESEDDSDGDPEETGRRKKRGKGPPPEPDSHLRVWMPACMVRPALSELVERYEASLEAKRTKKSKGKQRAAPATTKTKASSSKRKVVKPPVPHVDSDAEEFDLNVSCSSEDEEGGGGRSSPPPRPPAQATLPASRSQHAESIYKRPTQVSAQQQILDISTSDEEADEAPSKKFHSPLSSPSKVLQKLDLNLNPVANLCGAPPPPPSVSSPSACQGPPPSALRPFPMAFEEEESSDDENGYPSADPFATTATALRAQPRTSTPPPPPPRRQPLPIIPQEEGQLSSDDDPDMVIADLPVLVDTRDLSPEQGPPISGGSTRPASQTSPRRRASRYHPFPLPAKEARTDEGRIARAQGAAAETSIISISSGGSDDDDDLVLAPLLVARSRTLVPQKVTAKGRDAEDEVIDLT
jgi:Holliday junction resolvase YEN1